MDIHSESFLAKVTRILFFTGKGGVGKTSASCATAVSLANKGKQVLLVSTDPASNLDEVLGVKLAGQPTSVPGVDGLWALNIDPEAAAREYRERVVGPYRGVLPDTAVTSMEEQLSGACTVEIAAFDEFTKLLGDKNAVSRFDHVIFDTAPTGHTLRLLKLPSAWTGFIASNTTGTSCLGPLAGLQAQQALYEESLRTLADVDATTLVLVSRPESSALTEAERTRIELAELGMTNQLLLMNGVFIATDRSDEAALALERRGLDAMAQIAEGLGRLPRLEIPLLPFAPMGVEKLRRVFEPAQQPDEDETRNTGHAGVLPGPLATLIDEIERMGHGVVMTMGKGGVGKTTIAAAIAAELAHRGHAVNLSTTDPAAHVHATVQDETKGLQVSRIDPAAETARYTAEVLGKSASHLDEQGIALLTEDLRSPCTEEIAVFRAFAETVAKGAGGFVVLDTAPTGHTLLLLDAAEAYHRDVLRSLSDMPDSVRNLLPRLRDPEFTRVLLITLPEATPVHEAANLQEDLERAGIKPFGWVVNQSFAGNGSRDRVLLERGARELPYIDEVCSRLASRVALTAWKPQSPVGIRLLRELAGCEKHANEPVV